MSYLALRGIEANLGPENADTFTRDLHPDLKADFILANRAVEQRTSIFSDESVSQVRTIS